MSDPTQPIVLPPADFWALPCAVWVIVRSTGEYSDRIETPIRYCLSEEDAQRAIDLIGIEKQRDPGPKYRYVPPSAYQLDDGTLLPDDVDFMDPRARAIGHRRVDKPNAAEIEAQNERWKAERELYTASLNHVDPDGSWSGDEYYYTKVTVWPTLPPEGRWNSNMERVGTIGRETEIG